MKTRFPRNMKWDLVWLIIFFLFALGVENFLVILWANNVSGQELRKEDKLTP